MSHNVVGKNVRRVDGIKLVTGAPAFTDDIHLPGLLIGKIMPSPYAHARIRHIDVSKVRALPGVHAVLTYQDVPRVPHTTAGQAWPEPSPYDTYMLDPVQEAFLDHGAVQCGFCTPGMVLTAKLLVERYPDLTEDQVREALAGHFCRCTGYRKPVEAVLAAAQARREVAR